MPLTGLTPRLSLCLSLARWSFLCSVINVIKTMFGTSLPPVVCRRAHVLFTLFVFACLIVVSNTYRGVFFALFVFVLYFVCPVLPFSQDCPLGVL